MRMYIGWARAGRGALLAGLAGAGMWNCGGNGTTPTSGPMETGGSGSSSSSGSAAASSSSSSSGASGSGDQGGSGSGSGVASGSSSGGGSSSGNGSSSGGPAGSSSSSGASGSSGGSGAKSDAGASGSGSGGGSSSGGQTSTTVGFSSDRVIVTGVRGVTTPPASSVINVHNGGTTPVSLTALALSGANAALFQITPPTLPAMLAAGADVPVTVQLLTTGATLPAAPSDKNLGSTLVQATLTATLGSVSATASVFGLVLIQANYEPTLGQCLTTLGYKLNVGMAQNNWNPNTSMNAATLPGIEMGTDEVAAPYFTKVGAGNVTMSVVARFSPVGILPYGWYPKGTSSTRNKVGTMSMVTDAQTSDKARMVLPPLVAGSLTTFDPGATSFGLWVYSDQSTNTWNEGGKPVNGDYDYSEDSLNVPTATPPVHRYKSYPLKDATGAPIANSYLVAVEEAGNGDYQDYVFLLGNVMATQ